MGKWTIADIRRRNKAAGNYFFDRAAMKFFLSRIDRQVYEGPGGIFFVTSEQYEDSYGNRPFPRGYTVHEFDPISSDIGDLGDFNKIQDLQTARGLAKKYAKSGGPGWFGEPKRHSEAVMKGLEAKGHLMAPSERR